ncbi:hypothetical protein [Terriglobus tenax]|uniref:hypothetical protein n=1 Tax=Terriglobus tenax TaxID=1111115 RepID=UPI0021E06BC2|nr:hypothetical protein [Terriglobus tenax]
MPFDPLQFQAEVSLNRIPTEKIPLVAQEAMETGFDGPHVVRMAILENASFSEISDALPHMMTELGLSQMPIDAAAIRIARKRAVEILENGEDPLPSLPFFYYLMVQADYPEELTEVGYVEDSFPSDPEDLEQCRAWATEALENLLDPELREARYADRRKVVEEQRKAALNEWPYVWNSAGRRALLRERYQEFLKDRPPLWLLVVAAALLGWGINSWRIPLVLLAVEIPLVFLLVYWGQYRKLQQECRNILLRMNYPEDKI